MEIKVRDLMLVIIFFEHNKIKSKLFFLSQSLLILQYVYALNLEHMVCEMVDTASF